MTFCGGCHTEGATHRQGPEPHHGHERWPHHILLALCYGGMTGPGGTPDSGGTDQGTCGVNV
jgi:hypothetical protein